jgi:hypothetical protein
MLEATRDALIAVAGGSAVGSLVTALFTSLGWRQSERQRRIEWSREKVLEEYSNGIYYLTKLTITAGLQRPNDADLRQHYSEAVRWLGLLAAHRAPGAADVLQQFRAATISMPVDAAALPAIRAASDTAASALQAAIASDVRVLVWEPSKTK